MASGTSYNGWPANSNPAAIDINRAWEPIPGHRFPGGIKSGDVETIFTYLVVNLDARVEPIDLYLPGDEWGYHYKQSANSPKLISCHSSGTAIDYNATRHPNGRRNTWTPVQVLEIRKILAELDGVVRWLGDATGTPDEMHFEIRGTPADVARVAAQLEDDMSEIMDKLNQIELRVIAQGIQLDKISERTLSTYEKIVPTETVRDDIKLTRKIAEVVGVPTTP